MMNHCAEKCRHQKNGFCAKNDCKTTGQTLSGGIPFCPHFVPLDEKTPAAAENSVKKKQTGESGIVL